MKMRSIFLLLIFQIPAFNILGQAVGTMPPFTKWYQNPLGISPVSLHTGNGLWIPAAAVALGLIITERDRAKKIDVSFYNENAFSRGYYASKTAVIQSNVGALFHLRKWVAIGTEFTTYHVQDDVNDTWGFGVRPFARFYLYSPGRVRFYFESGAGLIAFIKEFPQPSGFFGDNRIGTHLNGSPKYGLGLELRLNDNISANLGVGHVHVSNGDHPSKDRNPGHDSNGFSLGILFKR